MDPCGEEAFSFLGAHQRDRGRLDLRNHHALDQYPFDAACGDVHEHKWLPVVEAVLGKDYELQHKGIVATEPKITKEQKNEKHSSDINIFLRRQEIAEEWQFTYF